jgi:hypothetical protein
MSVIASNSVNFVPIYQLLKNFNEVKPKEVQDEQIAKNTGSILDVAELSILNKVGQGPSSNPILSGKMSTEEDVPNLGNFVIQEKFSEAKQYQQHQLDSVLKNTDSVRLFIADAKEKAMAQQANQSKQKALFLI